MLNSSKVRFINYKQKFNIRYITPLGIDLLLLFLLLLLLLVSLYDTDKILQIRNISLISFMSIFLVVIYTDCSKQKAEILKDNHKKSGIYR